MTEFLIDTNTVSELVNRNPEPKVVRWIEQQNETALYLSVFSIGEIRQGITPLISGKRRMELEAWFSFDLRRRFAGRILPVDEAIAEQWGTLSADRRSAGRTMQVVDAVLAATALRHGLTLVTRNVRDFSGLGLSLVNPWDLL